jgi:ribonuclease D
MQDMRILRARLGDLPARILDTQIGAGLVEHGFPLPYAALLERHLGVTISKGATLSDWSRRPLSHEQLIYAAEDVRLLFPLWDRIASRAEEMSRTDAIMAACHEAREAALASPPWDEAWRDVPGSVVLAPHQTAILQELATWREEVAQEEDQPPRSILGDALLTELARRQPTSLEGLAADRRMPRAAIKRHGLELLERIRRAAARPSWAWPRSIPRGSPQERSALWLECFAEAEGSRAGWSPRLVLPRPRLEDLITTPPTQRSGLRERLGDWRDALVGDRLWSALQGEVGLRLAEGEVRAS